MRLALAPIAVVMPAGCVSREKTGPEAERPGYAAMLRR